MKRILLTGAAGFCGAHTLRHLMLHTDFEVVCPVTFRHRGNGDRIASTITDNQDWHKRVDVVVCDLTGPISDTTASRFGNIDEIWNIASESHVDRSITDPVPFVTNNVALMLNLLEYARQIDVSLFLQMSTDEVYGPAPKDYNHVEWDKLLPSNPYSASKAAQEAICISYWRTYDLPIVITNTMNLVGEMQDTEKFVPMIISKILSKKSVPVHVSPAGEPGSRYYLHARNLADAWLFLSKNHKAQMYPEFNEPSRYHIVGEEEVNNQEMVELIAEMMGEEPLIEKVNFHESRPGHDLRYSLDGSKIAALGWKAPIGFKESLRQTVEWTLAHKKWTK